MDRREAALRQLEPFIARARSFAGWDLTAARVTPLEPGPPWDYEAVARAHLARAGTALDLGTGGGEVLERVLGGSGGGAVATEEWVVNAPVARRRLAPLGVPVVRGSSLELPFRDAAFDLVLDRHEALDPAEVVRVLRPGGSVVTQQVDRDNWRELRAFFPGKQDFGDHFVAYGTAFADAGLHVSGERHSRRVAYATLGDFVLLLLVAPWEIPGFDPARDINRLLAFADACGSADGIVVTESRYLLVAEKPPA